MAQACATCHEEIGQQLARKQGFHGALRGVDASACGPCHLEHHGDDVALVDQHAFAKAGVAAHWRGISPRLTAYHLTGVHASLACEKCHPKARAAVLAKGEQRFLGLSAGLRRVSRRSARGALRRQLRVVSRSGASVEGTRELRAHLRLRLDGGHARIECARCHEKGTPHSVEALGGAAPKPVARASRTATSRRTPHASCSRSPASSSSSPRPRASRATLRSRRPSRSPATR